jgi:hypothetical protein
MSDPIEGVHAAMTASIEGLHARILALEEDRHEFRTRIASLELRFGAIETQLARHGRLLMGHEEQLSRIEKDQRRQFEVLGGKLDAIFEQVCD